MLIDPEREHPDRKRIIYMGNIGIRGTAMTVHALNVARLLKKIGYDTTFLCTGYKGHHATYEEHDGFPYYFTKWHIDFPKLSFFEWFLDELTGWKYIAELRKLLKTQKPDLILFYGYTCEKKLLCLCKEQHIPLVIERVDWFEKEDRKQLPQRYVLTPIYDYKVKHMDPQANGIIAISPYLYDYYQNFCSRVLWLPPVFPTDDGIKIVRHQNPGKIHLVYAGSLGGGKDKIVPLLQVIRAINAREIRVSMDIVGFDQAALNKQTGKEDWARLGVTAHGHCENSAAKQIITRADFSVLLRENKRYAKAGFSTKFTESMTLGVPVICTQVGGADTVIEDMVDGVLVKDNSVGTIQRKLEELLALEENQILAMKSAAWEKGRRLFSLDAHTAEVKRFLTKLEADFG